MESVPPTLPGPIEPRIAAPDPARRTLLIEVAVVLLVGVLPDLYRSIASYWHDRGSSDWNAYSVSLGLIVRSAQVSAPILYIVWVRRQGLASLGLVRPRWTDIPWAVLIVAVHWALYYGGGWVIGSLAANFWLDPSWLTGSGHNPRSISFSGQLPLLLLMSCANGFAEELVMRGYLVTRLRQLLGSGAQAIVLTAFLFASYHSYQGAYGVWGAFCAGMMTGIVLVYTGRLWPCILSHAIGDILPFLMNG